MASLRRITLPLLFLFLFPLSTLSLNNGLCRTPPMGWNSWNWFGCNTNCTASPNDCISEKLFMQMADAMVASGMAAVGYEYINIDDCWLATTRDAQGRLQPDPVRFPSGIKALADYVHSKGLKFGIYEDWGTYTCGGYPGTMGHEKLDAMTFAEWGVDYLKLDGCYANVSDMHYGYTLFSNALNATGRPIAFSCSWPAYDPTAGSTFNYTYIGEICNLWRLYDDIDFSWSSTESIIAYWKKHSNILAPAAGPGHWNDPDMLEDGNGPQPHSEHRVQMTLWAIWSAPLIAGNDLRSMDSETLAIMTNKEVIAVDQDPMGVQGICISVDNQTSVELWTKPLTPQFHNGKRFAVAFFNPTNISRFATATWQQLGLPAGTKVRVRDLWLHENLGEFQNAFSAESGANSALLFEFVYGHF